MLQAPSHSLSRVCGHGHIKKFWLMQMQKENQVCEQQPNKNSVVISSSSSSSSPLYANRASPSPSPSPLPSSSLSPSSSSSSSSSSTKALDVSQRRSPTHHTSNHLAASSSGYGESPQSIVLMHSCSSNFSRGINVSQSQRPSSSFLKEGEKEIPQEDSSSEAQVLNSSFSGPSSSSSSSHASPARPSSSNVLTRVEINPSSHTSLTAEITSKNDSSCKEESCLADGSASDLTLEPNLSPSHGHRDSAAHQPLLHPKLSSDLISKLDEGINVTKTDGRELDMHFHRAASNTKSNNHMEVSNKVNRSNGGSYPSASRKIEAMPNTLDSIDKWKTTNMEFNGKNQMEISPRGSAQLVLKACSLCGTTKTPMWRSGPQGPKSLCNACGIRFKKYRSLPGQSDVELRAPILGNSPPSPKYLSKPLKRKQNSNNALGLKPIASDASHHQKKSKWHQLVIKNQMDLLRESPNAWKVSSGPASLKKIYGCLQSRFRNLGPSDDYLTLKGVFAKDEEEAAVLLMHLSCGLVC